MKQLKDKEYEEYQQYLYNKAHGYIWTPDTLELICNGNDGEPEQIGKQVLGMTVKLRNEQVSLRLSDKHKSYVIRLLRKNEVDLLKDFLYEAIFIPKGTEPPARDIIEKPELRVYTDDFGARKGDNCLVADFGGKNFDVCSQGDFIDRGERVQVVQITGKTVTVRACGENQ